MQVLKRAEAIKQNKRFYYTGQPCKRKHISFRYVANYECVECAQLTSGYDQHRPVDDDSQLRYPERTKRAHRNKIKQRQQYYTKNKEQILKQQKSYVVSNFEQHLISTARARAKRKGIEFCITKKDIHIPTHCPVLGILLCKTNYRGESTSSPSIDRIDNTRGYVPGNVCVISARANRIKNDASLEELKEVVKYLETHAKE